MQSAAVSAGVQGNPIFIDDDDTEPENGGSASGSKRRRKYEKGDDPFNYFQHVRLARLRECKRLKRFSTATPPSFKISLATLQPPEIITLDDDEPWAVDLTSSLNNDRAMHWPSTVPLAQEGDVRINWSDLAAPVISPTLKVEQGVLALPCLDPPVSNQNQLPPPPFSSYIWTSLDAGPNCPPNWGELARKPANLVAASPLVEFGASYQLPLQMDAATSGLEASEDYEDTIDWKTSRDDSLQFKMKHPDSLFLRDEVAGDVSSPQEVESGPVPVGMDGIIAGPNGRERVTRPEKVKVSTRAKVRVVKGPTKRLVTAEETESSEDESSDDEQKKEDEMRLAEKRRLEEEEARLWRAADIALALTKPTVVEEEEKKPVGCVHSFVRNPENGQSCEECGMVKPAMSVEFTAPLRAAYRRAKREATDCTEEDTVLENVQPDREEVPLEKLNIKIPPHFLPKMKDHQVQAFKFLVKCLDGRGGCVFAHAPGTGKTFLMITFVKALLTYYPKKKVLIVVPKGMLGPWKEEFNRWKVMDIRVFDLFDNHADIPDLVDKRKSTLQNWIDNKSVLLASYRVMSEIIRKNPKENGLRQLIVETPDVVILDEAHVLRNDQTQILKALRELRTKSRVMLSGTLFQNKPEELYHMLKFVKSDFLVSDPEFLQSYRAAMQVRCQRLGNGEQAIDRDKNELKLFMEKYGAILVDRNDVRARASALQRIQKLRGLLSFVDCHEGSVLKVLPGLHEFVVKVRLLPHQAEILRHIDALDLDGMSRDQFAQQISIHRMVMKSKPKDEARAKALGPEDPILDPSRGAKTNFVFEILNLCNKAGEKLIVFSYFTSALGLIQTMLIQCWKWNFGDEILRIDGKSSGGDRLQTIMKFNDPTHQSKVLLGSIKACGEGISLVGASRMVLLDASWNPSVTCQAVSRAYRLGQSRKVYVYHLIADGTTEETIRKAAIQKDWVFKNLVGDNEVSDHEVQVDPRTSVDLFFQSPTVLRDVAAIYEVVRQH